MLIKLILAISLITLSTAQENTKQQDPTSKQNEAQQQSEQQKQEVVYLEAPNTEGPQQNEIQPSLDLKQYYSGQQFSPEFYRVPYLEQQYQAEGAIPRLQPQIVFYGSGGQGQPILINPGNPPGNFLFPQGPGPNVIVRNNPQGPIFPVAGYPKPVHLPPIEKDAEEIPTDPAKVLPLPSQIKPVAKPKKKPEKLETFTESNQPEQNVNVGKGQLPQFIPDTASLQPGQRFFVLNGNNIYNYPFEEFQPQIQPQFPAFRYTNVQPFPENPPKYLQTFGQEPSQILPTGPESISPVPVPTLIQRNSPINPQQPDSQAQQPASQPQQNESQPKQIESQPKQTESQPQQPNQQENDGALKTIQQYFRTAEYPATPPHLFYGQYYPLTPQGELGTNIPNVQGVTSRDAIIQPQLIGQFRFTPSAVPGLFNFKDDYENDAIVVDASFDAPNNLRGSLKAEESESTTPGQQQPAEKEPEPSMAQAGPKATAIAGPGGVAGSAPRGTAIVGKGGLAVSSPQATAVAGTKEEEKKKRPVKKPA